MMKTILRMITLTALCTACCTKQSDGSQKCEYTLNSCSNEVNGYVVFSNGANPHAGSNVVIEWSDDSFTTHKTFGAAVNNLQGMIAIPFHFDANYTCGTVPQIQIRAFESQNGTNAWTSGDTVGRYDGTTNSNTTYKTISAASATEILIYLDGQGAQ